MKKIHHSILIQAPREKVWDVMLGDATYREWTTAFNPGSYFKGDWSEGSKILFLGPDPENPNATGESGMVSRIKENRLHEFMSIEHLGLYKNGVEDYESDEVKKWAPSFENYTFTEKDGGTEVSVDMDAADEYEDMFNGMWPEALKKLKEVAER